jgi:hypothetical protein
MQAVLTYVLRWRGPGANGKLPEVDVTPEEDLAFNAITHFAFDPQTPPPLNDNDNSHYDSSLDNLLFATATAMFFRDVNPTQESTCLLVLVMRILWLAKRDESESNAAVKSSTASGFGAIFQFFVYSLLVHTLRLRSLEVSNYSDAAVVAKGAEGCGRKLTTYSFHLFPK